MLFLVTQKGHFPNGNMQHQNGGANSGLFAILAAVCLCHGEDSAAHLKNQSLVRKHNIENPDSTMKPVP